MKKDTCLTCCHFHPFALGEARGHASLRGEIGPHGECRRDPPVMPFTYEGRHDEVAVGAWPKVHVSTWCGQHAPKTTAAPVAPAKPKAESTEIVLKWNSTVLPVICAICENPFTPPDGACLTIEGTWDFVCLDCAAKLAPQAARDCRLLMAAHGREYVPHCEVVGWTPRPKQPVTQEAT